MGRLRLRTFIAVPLEAGMRRRIDRLRDELAATDPSVKWVEPENLHVTLLFLGEIDAVDVVGVCKAVRRVTQQTDPFMLSAAGVGCFPNARRPKTLWVGVDQGREELVALHAALEDPLLQLGAYRREDREFTPHITLGRVRSGEVTADLRARLIREADWHGGQQMVSEIHVMSSEMLSDGPRYTVVSRERLSSEPNRP